MSHELTLRDEISRAIRALPAEDRKRIKSDKAESVLKTLDEILSRKSDKGEAIKNTLAERHIGAEGEPASRQKVYAAYWRLYRRILDDRERRVRPKRRVA